MKAIQCDRHRKKSKKEWDNSSRQTPIKAKSALISTQHRQYYTTKQGPSMSKDMRLCLPAISNKQQFMTSRDQMNKSGKHEITTLVFNKTRENNVFQFAEDKISNEYQYISRPVGTSQLGKTKKHTFQWSQRFTLIDQ